jgi:hypothetical protein
MKDANEIQPIPRKEKIKSLNISHPDMKSFVERVAPNDKKNPGERETEDEETRSD